VNCTDFNALLHEFLDGTLRGNVQDAAREHLEECGDCRRALLREKAFAQSIRHSFERATTGISPRPGMRRDILALSSKSAPPEAWQQRWRNFISSVTRPARASAALLCLLTLFGGILLFHRTVPSSKITAETSQYSRVIDVPIPVQTHVFQYENGTVVDAIVTRVAIGHAAFFENEKPSPKTL
jgi:anti-sigma factor RsiW